MKRRQILLRAWVALLLLGPLATAHAVTINIQYSSNPLFSTSVDPTAKAAIGAAAADLSSAITTTLNAINTDSYTGSNGSTTATIDWYYEYTNPTTGGTVQINPGTIGANTVTMFVGVRNLGGTTLGQGGHAGLGININGSGSPNQWIGAMANANAGASNILKRGSGPTMGNLSGTSPWGAFTATIDVDYGVAYGSLTLDSDTTWHYDHTTPVAVGKNDLYSVALHEMLHALGIGASDSWDSKTSGTSWTGSQVLAITGSGSNLIAADGAHIAPNTMSQRITDGAVQEVAMDPTITVGTRKYLTVLDLAFLRDIGFSTINPTFNFADSDFNTDGAVDADDLTLWRNAYGLSASGDADNDGDTDGRDYLIWQREYTGAQLTTTTTVVPEPAGVIMLLVGGGMGMFRRPGNSRGC